MENLFQNFTRLEEHKNRNIEGTGLGLSLTKRLVDMMHGEVLVESRYGGRLNIYGNYYRRRSPAKMALVI